MSRARATALILVNWRGVFFERYLLDRHVTALEGANGAGKTTVMIGAYVVLLPDLTRLKFTNLGETGATGGDRGIYGRLGEPGPSYAAIEIDIDGRERIFAAVYLERKAAPSLTLTPFILSQLADDVAAHRIFLREADAHEHVATMADIEEAATATQAKLEVFGSAKEYFGSLFERGVSPLRLGLDEERNKFNDMLRTSMTGGISRTLTSDLRSFLFKQQTGLFDTLTRMRKNLDACRRTRLEVSEARALEHEINGVYTAGHAMVVLALEGTRSKANEHREAAERADATLAAERAQIEELGTRQREAESRSESVGPRLARARAAESAARERLAELTRALAAAERVAHIDAERARLLPEVELASGGRQEAAADRELARAQRDAAQQTLARAAAGLASLQAGLEELHRQAHAHRRVRERIGAARAALAEIERHADGLGLPDPDTRVALAALGQELAAATSDAADTARARLAPDLLASGCRRVREALRG
ncbi:MAG TPA: chromosome partition protein MukB, partial [Polyangiaceae bacterium]|nr:chromosome partition protein MukB [Polyangiaceae bacterium]